MGTYECCAAFQWLNLALKFTFQSKFSVSPFAEIYTLIVECCKVLAKKVAKRHNVHLSVRHGEPD